MISSSSVAIRYWRCRWSPGCARHLIAEFSVREFFDAPTVAGVAARIDNSDRAALPPILPSTKTGALPVSSAQQLFWRMDDLLSGADFLNLPYGYRLSGRLNQAALRRAIEKIMARHGVLRTVFNSAMASSSKSSGAECACRLGDSIWRRSQSQSAAANLHGSPTRMPRQIFDLDKGPPFRVTLIRLAAAEHILLVTMHHMIADQWSMRLFRRELAAFYKAFAQGEPAAVAALPYQFADFSRWQRRMLDTGGFDDQLNFWQKRLAGPLPTIEFPAVGKRRKKLTLRSGRLSMDMKAAVSAAIHELARGGKPRRLSCWLRR